MEIRLCIFLRVEYECFLQYVSENKMRPIIQNYFNLCSSVDCNNFALHYSVNNKLWNFLSYCI